MKTMKAWMAALLLCLVCGTAGAQDKEYARELLEYFCGRYFEEAFDGKRYLEKTLTIRSLEMNTETKATEVRGTVSYQGVYVPLLNRMTHRNVDYIAELSRVKEGIEIRFWLYHIPTVVDFDRYWMGPFTKVLLP